MINEDINEIIEQIFTLNDIFNEKNSLRIEEVFILFYFIFILFCFYNYIIIYLYYKIDK